MKRIALFCMLFLPVVAWAQKQYYLPTAGALSRTFSCCRQDVAERSIGRNRSHSRGQSMIQNYKIDFYLRPPKWPEPLRLLLALIAIWRLPLE